MQFYHILTFAHKTSVTSIFIQYFIIIMSAGYATSLIEALRESYMDSPKALQEVSANLSACAPAPIAKSFQQFPKEEAVSLYLAQQSRYKKLN